MKRKKVGVFSSNPTLSRFFEIEAISFGFDVIRYDDFVEIENNFDLIVVDSDTVSVFPEEFSCPVCIVSSTAKNEKKIIGDKLLDCYILPWPTSINDFRQILKNIYIFIEKGTPENKDEGEDIIYYSKQNKGIVLFKNKKISLSELEMKLLILLCEANGNAIDRATLNKLFGDKGGNIVDVYIHHLRKKFEEPFSHKIIYTVRSKGYKITAKLKTI